MKTYDAKTIRGKFQPSSTAEREFYKQLKKVAQASGHLVDQYTHKGVITAEKELQDELRRYSEKLGPWAERQAAKMLLQVQNSNKRAYQIKSKSIGLKLKLDVAEQNVGRVARTLLHDQVGLIKSLPLEAGLRAQEISAKNFYAGTRAEANAGTIQELVEQMGMSTEVATTRAMLIARTETARANATINQARAMAVGSNQYRWHNSGDEAVRPSHKRIKGRILQGMIFSWDSPPTLDDGMTGHPGEFPNCFPGSTKLTGSSFIQKFYRRRYSGKLTELVFEDGTILRATPNHPIFTGRGLKPIHSINIGDNAVSEREEADGFIKNNIKGFDISLEQAFNASLNSNVFVKSSSVGGQFHGDVTNEEVDIVSIDGRLVSKIAALAEQKFYELSFSQPNMARAGAYFFGVSAKGKFGLLNNPPHDFVMSGANLTMPFLQTHFRPLDFFCLAMAPYVSAGLDKCLPDDNSRDTSHFRDLIFAYSALIHGFDFLSVYLESFSERRHPLTDGRVYPSGAKLLTENIFADSDQLRNVSNGIPGPYKLNRVIDKRVSDFSSQVYNLQTANSFYIADSIFSGNCRCFAEPVFPSE